MANLVYDLPHELPNDFGLRVLGNEEMLGKSQIWVGRHSAQSPLQKLNFGNSIQKTCKSRYETFLAPPSLTGFFYFVLNILSRIIGSVIGNELFKGSYVNTLIGKLC